MTFIAIRLFVAKGKQYIIQSNLSSEFNRVMTQYLLYIYTPIKPRKEKHMKYKTLNPFLDKAEDLPHWEYIPAEADKIILGTFPTYKKNRQFEFFYPNLSNRFWNVLSSIAGITLSGFEKGDEWKRKAVEERHRILDKLNLAITDIGAKVYRQGNSSLDSMLFPIEFSDIFQILDNHPTINTIILTSSSSGNSVLSWFSTYCGINGVNLEFEDKKKIPRETEIVVSDRRVKVKIVYSPSSVTRIPIEELIDQYKGALL